MRVQLEVDISAVIDARLMEGHLDLALQSGPFKTKAYAANDLGEEAYCWVAHPALGRAIGRSAKLSDLFEHTILTHAKHTQAGLALHRFARDHGFGENQIVHSSALSACVPMALEGLGVALLPARLVRGEIEAGALSVINCDWLPAPLAFHARYAPHRAPLFVGKAAAIAADAMAFDH